MELFGTFSDQWPYLSQEDDTPFINLPLKEDFLISPSFPSAQIGSIAQKENPETLEAFVSLKTLNFVSQARKHFTSIWHISHFKNLNSK